MADNEILIDQIVNLTATGQQVDELLKQINRIDERIQQINKQQIQLGSITSLVELRRITDELQKSTSQLTKAVVDTANSRKAATKVELDAQKALDGSTAAGLRAAKSKTEESKQNLNAAKSTRELERAKQEELKTQKLLQDQSDRDQRKKEQQAAKEAALQRQIANEYLNLSKRYNELALEAKNYAITLGENHPTTIQATKDAFELGEYLKKLDAMVGQHKRNVGNYSSAFTGLHYSLQQIIREAPTLAISFQMFALAASNNLPIFFDAIRTAREENVKLAADGMKPVPVLAQLGKSLFSLSTVLALGVTLFTIYAGKLSEWVQKLIDGEDKTARITRKIAEFNKEIEDTKKSVDAFTDSLDALQKLARINIDINVLNVPELDKMGGDLEDIRQRSIDQMETTQMLTEAEQRLSKVRHDAYAEYLHMLSDADRELLNTVGGVDEADKVNDKLSANAKKAWDAFKTADKERADMELKQQQSGQAQRILFRSVAKEQAEMAKHQAQLERDLLQNTIIEQAEQRKNAAEHTLADERSSFTQRRRALEQHYRAEKAIIDANAAVADPKSKLFNPELSPEERKGIMEKAATETLRAKRDLNQKIFEENKNEALRNADAERKIFEQQKKDLSKVYDELSQVTAGSLDQRLQLEENFFQAQKAILDKEREYEQKQDSYKYLTAEEKLQKEKDYESKVLNLKNDTQKRITEQLKIELDKQEALRQRNVDQIQDLFSKQTFHLDDQYTADVIALNDSLHKKEISLQTYNNRRLALDQKYARESLKLQIDEVEAEIKQYDGSEQRYRAVLDKKDSLERQYLEAKSDAEKQDLARQIEITEKELKIAKIDYETKKKLLEELNKLKKQYSEQGKGQDDQDEAKKRQDYLNWLEEASNLQQAMQTIYEGAFNARMQMLDDEMTALDDRYSHEQDLINKTSANEEEKKKRMAELDAKYAGQRKALEEQERMARIRKAQLDKEAAIFAIIINTARAVVEALPNTVKAITVGVLGAAQLAVAISAPLPRYYRGKNAEDNYEGYAIVDDGPNMKGKAELIVREDGSMEVGKDEPRVTWLGKKDRVYPDAQEALKRFQKSTGSVRSLALERSMLNSEAALVPLYLVPSTDQHLWREQNGVLRRGFSQLRSELQRNRPARPRPMGWRELWELQRGLGKS